MKQLRETAALEIFELSEDLRLVLKRALAPQRASFKLDGDLTACIVVKGTPDLSEATCAEPLSDLKAT